MEPPNYKSVMSKPELEPFRKGEGSLKLKGVRPRSRTGSGGILRLDITKPTLASNELGQVNPPSPQPSVDRLSVTFAADEKSVCSSDTSVKLNVFKPGTPPISCMEKVRFPTITDGEDSEEDYSASVTAIMQRRASTRKSRRKSRRTSSPFSHEMDGLQVRRRSSCFTTSSGDTAISMEESLPQEVTQEQIFENIRLHKEVLSSVKMQPWIMRRKLKLVQQAKSYIKRHEGVLQERLAQSRSTKDILARWNIYLVQKWQHYKRELANLSNLLIPWESRIKEIESHFGSVVASYFTFLRWLFWVNLIISVVLVAFVAIPELLTADKNSAGERKVILPEEKAKATNLFTLWDFEGVLKYSPMFYGYYTNREGTEKGYKLPVAYFMTGLGVYVYSFVATLRKMAKNSRMSKLSEKDDECVFSWKLFTGWDYMIGNAETAQNRTASIILGFKEALLEEAEKKREPRNWKIIAARVLVNFLVMILLVASAYAVVLVVERSTEAESSRSFWRRNEITVVMSLISLIFPIFFEVLGLLEHYHPRKQLRLQLARIMVLNMLNLYSLIFALFAKIRKMTAELQLLKNATMSMELLGEQYSTESWTPDPTMQYGRENETCYDIYVDCTHANATSYPEPSSASLISTVLRNISLAVLLTNLTQNNPVMNDTNINSTTYFDHLVTRDSNFYNYSDITTSINNFTVPENFTDNFENVTNTYYDYNNFKSLDVNSTDYFVTNSSDDLINNTFFDSFENITYYNEMLNDSNSNLTNVQSDVAESTNDDEDDYYDYYDYHDPLNSTDDDYDVSTTIMSNISTTETYDVLSTIISKILNYTLSENVSDSQNVTLSTSWNETTTEDIITTLLPFLNTTLDTPDVLAELTTYFPEINATLINLYQNITKETKSQCLIRKCEPIINVNLSLSNTNLAQIDKRQNHTPSGIYDYKIKKKLRSLCWETMFGQELVKLTVMDLSFTIISILSVDFIRAIFVRVMNNCWCWDLEKQFPQYGDFKIAENILHLVNNQGMVWMGMFFSPGITVINLVKLAIIMYLRSWAVLTCNVPHEVVFRASRSNNFYLALLLTMLFLCVLPVGYAIVWIKPSWHCGPFSNYHRIYYIFNESLKQALPKITHQALDYIASPFIVIPLLVLLVLIIYYMVSLTNALREANNDLKMQLRRERTEERRKMFQIANRGRRSGSGDSGEFDSTPFGKWKKLLPMLPNSKSFEADMSSKDHEAADDKNDDNKNKDFLVKFIKKNLRKPNSTPDEGNRPSPQDDATDTEQHDSLPDDVNTRDAKLEKENKVLSNFKKLLNAKKQQSETQPTTASEHKTKTMGPCPSDKDKTNGKSRKAERIRDKYRSTSRSSSSKDLRQDSITSNWSDNIPVIKIIGTGSSECILEQQNESSPPQVSQSRKPRKITHQQNIDMDNKSEDITCELQIAEPQCPTSSSETLVTARIEDASTENGKDSSSFLTCDNGDYNKSKFDNPRITNKEKSSIDTDQSVEMQKSNNSDSTQTSSQTKTESSTGYKE